MSVLQFTYPLQPSPDPAAPGPHAPDPTAFNHAQSVFRVVGYLGSKEAAQRMFSLLDKYFNLHLHERRF
jgi:hypothetical protein